MPAPKSDYPIYSENPLSQGVTEPGWVKIDFHLHTSEDPFDELEHSAVDLLYRACSLGFGALAITLHDHVLWKPEVVDLAAHLGILLIPAAEVRLEGADVVIVNVTEDEVRDLKRLRDLEALRRRRGKGVFIFAPHPFYRIGGSIGHQRLVEHIDLFDAIELCHFHTRLLDPNRPACLVAQQFKKPLIATSDAHRLDCFGNHYSLVQAERNPEAIFEGIRSGACKAISPHWPPVLFLKYICWIFAEHEVRLIQARLAGH